MANDPILHLIGLAKKAGRLEIGEEPVGAACRARQAKLLLIAADAAPNTFRRAAHFGEAGRVLWLELPFSKGEVGGCVGRTSCAMLAVMDAGFAAAIAGKLRERDPERYQAASLQLEDRAARALQRQREQRRHEKKLQQGQKKPWAPPPPKDAPPPPHRPPRTAGERREDRPPKTGIPGRGGPRRGGPAAPGTGKPGKGAPRAKAGQKARPPQSAGRASGGAAAPVKPGRALSPGRKVTVRGRGPDKQ